MIGNLFSWVLSHLGETAAALAAGAIIWFLLSRASAKWEKEEEQSEGSILGGLLRVLAWGLGILLVIAVAGYTVLGGIHVFRHLSNQLCRTAPVLCPIQTVVSLTTTGESIAPKPGPADPTPGPADPTPGPADPTPGPADPTPQPSGCVWYTVTYQGDDGVGLNCRSRDWSRVIRNLPRGDICTTGEVITVTPYQGSNQAVVTKSGGIECAFRIGNGFAVKK